MLIHVLKNPLFKPCFIVREYYKSKTIYESKARRYTLRFAKENAKTLTETEINIKNLVSTKIKLKQVNKIESRNKLMINSSERAFISCFELKNYELFLYIFSYCF